MFGLGQVQLIGLAVVLGLLLTAIVTLVFVNRGLERDIAERDTLLAGYSFAITVSNDAMTAYEKDKATARATQKAAEADADKIAKATASRVQALMERLMPQDCAGVMQALRDDAGELGQW